MILIGAGMSSTAATYPFDIMRTQFAIQVDDIELHCIICIMLTIFIVCKGKEKIYPNIRSFVTHTIKTQGVSGMINYIQVITAIFKTPILSHHSGFYAGLPAALVGITPYMGLNFALYETCKTAVEKLKNTSKSKFNEGSGWKILSSGLCGAVAGGVSKFAVFPLDTIKKRMQSQVLRNSLGTGIGPKYSSVSNCFLTILRTEGVTGLYKVHVLFNYINSDITDCVISSLFYRALYLPH